jgi:hypothetical protein
MYSRLISAAFITVLAVTSPQAQEQDRATVQMRDGTKVEGRIEELAQGTLFLRVTQDDQRRIPVSNIALIDRRGAAAGLPDTEVREARNAEHLLLLADGSSVKGQMLQIVGGEGSGVGGPRTYTFRTSAGEQRSYSQGQVTRIYLGSYPFEATARPADAAVAQPYVPAGGIRVPATASWVATGITVRKGEIVMFEATGEVRLSNGAEDRAQAAGTNRTARFAPLPDANAGALIGRVGGNGRAFGIGDQASVPMPAAGMLYLAVNDDDRADNAGEFIVVANRRR